MRHPNFVILYVEDPTVSVGFYINLFNQQPVELESTFALFVLNSGLKFGLWSKKSVEPAAIALPTNH